MVSDRVLRGDKGEFLPIQTIRRRTRRFWQKPFRVWNIGVDHWHTFFADDVGVHNKGCFLAGTQIRLGDESDGSIETVKVGQFVKSFNPEKGIIVSRILETHKHTVRGYYTLVFQSGRILQVTGEHPIYNNGRFVTVDQLEPSDIVLLDDSRLDTLAVKVFHDVTVEVWNLTVDGAHTYYANHILVHNKGSMNFWRLVKIAEYSLRSGASDEEVIKELYTWPGDYNYYAILAAAKRGETKPPWSSRPWSGPVPDIWAWLGHEARIEETEGLWAQGYAQATQDGMQNAREAAYYAVYDLMNQGIIQKGSKYWNLEDSFQAAVAISPGLSLKLYDDSNR
jgi:hypothetical protein